MVTKITTTDNPAWNRYRRIVGLRWTAEKCFLDLGKELTEFQEAEQWRNLDYDSFNAFLADPEVNISRRTAYRMMRVWKQYVIELDVQYEKLVAIGGTKLDMIAGHVNQGNVDKWLNVAVTLSKGNLKAEIDGKEPVYTPTQWRTLLHEARNACELLARCESAPTEVREFALDFWSATEARV